MGTLSLLVLLAHHVIITLSTPDCKYFASPYGGPYIPIDVCTQYQYVEIETNQLIQGSYQYECLHGNIVAHYWSDSTKCDGEIETKSDPYYTSQKQCDGHMCDYVAFRVYPQLYPGEDTCAKDEESFFEYPLTVDCWNTYENAEQSRSLACNEDSFTLNYYDSPVCDEIALMSSKDITSGCKWFLNGTIHANKTIPFLNETISFTANQTYFEITACGKDNDFIWLWLVVSVGGFCCLCCCIALVCKRLYSRRAKSSDRYIQSV